MTDTMTDLEAISAVDQIDAYRRSISDAVARHYTTLTAAGIGDKAAVKLCREFQGMLMEPEAAEVNVFVGEGE